MTSKRISSSRRRPRAGDAAAVPAGVIAAIGRHHRGPMAARLVDLAADAGAAGVKFQLRRASDDPAEPSRNGSGRPHPRTPERSRGPRLSSHDVQALRRQARARGLEFIAAPYEATDFAATIRLNPDRFEIDPATLANRELLSLIAKTGRPVTIVAGMCTERVLDEALSLFKRSDVVILHAVMAPTLAPAQTRLGMLSHLRERFGRPVGYLSLEGGTRWSLVAAAFGAVIIEKPFALDPTMPGEMPGAVGPDELRQLALDLRALNAAGAPAGSRVVFPEELDLLEATQYSIVARRRLRKGATLTDDDFALEAPVRGISGRMLAWARGRRLLYDLEVGEPITFGVLDLS